MNDKPRKRNDESLLATMALIGQVGFYIALPPVMGGLVGQKIDNVLHNSTPLATILGLLLGLAIGVFLVVRAISRLPE
jgi:F0F1-type ATP synthase assembly protein I